jgi:hypothetical protein
VFAGDPELRELLGHHRRGQERMRPCGQVVNTRQAVFTFVHCASSRRAAVESGAAEAALWFVNAAPRVFQVPRSIWIDAIRGQLQANDPAATRSLAAPEQPAGDEDLDDPIPVIRLLNRQRAVVLERRHLARSIRIHRARVSCRPAVSTVQVPGSTGTAAGNFLPSGRTSLPSLST